MFILEGSDLISGFVYRWKKRVAVSGEKSGFGETRGGTFQFKSNKVKEVYNYIQNLLKLK